jgi:Tol biopolymer transport system component
MNVLLFVAAALASPTQIAGTDGANLQRPSWSPDGQQLAYEANFHEEKRVELHVGDPTTGAWQKVSTSSAAPSSLTAGFAKTTAGRVVQELSWGPTDIGRFVYSAANDSKDYDLYISGGSAVAPGPSPDGGPAWSLDGRYIVFTSARSGEGDLYTVDVHAIDQDPARITDMADSSELFATWSPAGAIAFVAHTKTGDNIYVVPSLGMPPKQLTDWQGSQIRPSFSPNGEQVAFYANYKDRDRFDLYVTNVTGDETQQVAKGVVPDLSGPSWTPDGRHLLFVKDDNAAYDPLMAVPVGNPDAALSLDLGTVGNGDLAVAERNGKLWLAWVAQGQRSDDERSFARLFLDELPALP